MLYREYKKRKLKVDNTSKISLKPSGLTFSDSNNAEEEQVTVVTAIRDVSRLKPEQSP